MSVFLLAFFLPVISKNAFFPHDFESYHYPLLYSIFNSFKSGVFPLWDNGIYSGMPLGCNIQAGLFYPVHLIYFSFLKLLNLEFSLYQMQYLNILHFFIAGSDFFLFLKELKIPSPYTFLGGILIVSNFIKQALTNRGITIFGGGRQIRSICYVSDMIDGMLRMMNGPDQFTGPVNKGNPAEISIIKLARMIIRLTGSKSKIIHQQLPQDETLQRKPNISLAKSELEWQPSETLESGIKKTIEYFQKIL